MNRHLIRMLLSLSLGWITFAVRADEPPGGTRSTFAPNAAVVYWQAFATMPDLTHEEESILGEAEYSADTPLTSELEPIVARHEHALHELHRATRLHACDWQLDNDAGPNVLLPHLKYTQDLSRAALLRARLRFKAGETDAAIDDVLTVFKLARDCGSSPIEICTAMDASIEETANAVLAAHLPILTREQFDRIEKTLQHLPARADIVSVIRGEEMLGYGWLKREIDANAARLEDPVFREQFLRKILADFGLFEPDGPAEDGDDLEAKRAYELYCSMSAADLKVTLERLHAHYQTLARIAELPLADRPARIDQMDPPPYIKKGFQIVSFEPKTTAEAPTFLAYRISPKAEIEFFSEERYQIQSHLLKQAIRVQRDGPQALEQIPGRFVEYKQTPTGFELRCTTGTPEKQPITLSVGRPS